MLGTGQRLSAVDVSDPSPRAGEVVIEIRAAGICHSDGHYRAGRGNVRLPLTLGHEIAGVVVSAGRGVKSVRAGDRVAVHYLISCGDCDACRRRGEQFCETGRMIGKELDGGYAERIVIPAANAIPVPETIPFDQAAIMMCSTATVYHALRLASLQRGETVAILGFGGLGVSALKVAQALGAGRIIAVDVVPSKLDLARSLGAEVATELKDVDIAVELSGQAPVCLTGLRGLAPGGRMMLVAINLRSLTFDPYADVLGRERRIIGCSDHTRQELLELMAMGLDLSEAITRRVPLEEGAINDVLDDLDRGTDHLRTVIEPPRHLT
ncbi:MAG: alcohol dehydrogenase catalytic domain-containing protein [Thermoanaerobaculia bacterium]